MRVLDMLVARVSSQAHSSSGSGYLLQEGREVRFLYALIRNL